MGCWCRSLPVCVTDWLCVHGANKTAGLLCIPRSGVGSDAEVQAIRDENSPRGVRGKGFSAAELQQIDALGAEMLSTGLLSGSADTHRERERESMYAFH